MPEPEPDTLAADIRRRIETVYELPPMPEIAHSILQLRNDPHACAADLAKIVELDPSLAAQVMRYARSAFFGFRGNVDTVHAAISRVLGFDLVMNLALGLATGRSLRNPVDGPLGLRAFWKHAVFSAALVQALARLLPSANRPKPGTAYLAGLLHNFGFLLLGHLFPPEFRVLNQMVEAHPETPITELEHGALGMGQAFACMHMGHACVGAWLMERWNLPEEVVVALREHHHPDYAGPHAVFPQLVMVANHLLCRHGIGDVVDCGLPRTLLFKLGLRAQDAEAALERLMLCEQDLDAMSQQLAAA